MNSLSLDVEPVVYERKTARVAPVQIRFESVTQTYVPARALACSFIIHEIAVFALLFVSAATFGIAHSPSKMLTSVIDLSSPRDIVYLPSLGGGSEGNGRPGAGQGGQRKGSSELPARSSKGFSYPGTQQIISDPPRAVNPSQTLLHPTIKNPPLLQQFVPLPNLVQMANAGPAQPPQPVQPLTVKPEEPLLRTRALPTVEAPKLTVPASTSNFSELLPAPGRTMPKLKVTPPPPVEISDLQMNGPDQKNVLALSPVPPPAQVPVSIPNGEARGRFAISPEPTVATPEPGPGSRSGGAASGSTGIGDRAETAASNAIAGDAGASTGSSSGGSGEGGVSGHGIGKGGSNGGGTGTNGGRGSAYGSGVGEGSGNGSGSGAGAGSGPGHGGFPGITIQGGQLGGTGSVRTMAPSLAPSVRGSYSMTIVSTPSSGGGLPDFGVFYNEKIYTVYLDMKSNAADHAPSWTLQYALMSASGHDSAAPASIRIQGTVTAPYAVTKELPRLPADLQEKYSRTLIVVSAVMDTNGRLGQVLVRETPDVRVIQPIIDALTNWIFAPAELNGQPVPLKVLLGIRLSPP